RGEDRPAPRIRGHGVPRRWTVRGRVQDVPVLGRGVRLVQPQLRDQPVSRRGKEDVRPGDRRADARPDARCRDRGSRRRLHDGRNLERARRDEAARRHRSPAAPPGRPGRRSRAPRPDLRARRRAHRAGRGADARRLHQRRLAAERHQGPPGPPCPWRGDPARARRSDPVVDPAPGPRHGRLRRAHGCRRARRPRGRDRERPRQARGTRPPRGHRQRPERHARRDALRRAADENFALPRRCPKSIGAEQMIHGPTYSEMRDPSRLPEEITQRARIARREAPLDPVNLFNITWHEVDGRVRALRLPEALTGVASPIVLLYAKDFPTGAHKVGATYSVLMEHQLAGDVAPGASTLVWPSTGNYGIGGAWVGPRMGYESVVILPEEMSAERFEKIAAYGATAIKTPGCESNVKEIYDECHRLAADPRVRIMNQFAEMANYRWHYHVTGAAAAQAVETLGAGRPAAFVSAMGSAGTIAAGDALKARFGTRIVGLEPVQCPTLSRNGYGGHAIEGIGDKHVTWIHHVTNLDALICLDDEE